MRKKRVVEVISIEKNDKGKVIGVWIKTENPYREELHVLYLKKLEHTKDAYYYPVDTPNIEIVNRVLPEVFKLTKRNAFEIDYPLRRRCFLLAWKILWPDLPPTPIVKKKYYGIILEGYKKGVKPEMYIRYAVSEDNAKEIIRHAYNRDHGFPDDHWVLMRTGEVKKRNKPKPRKLFKD